MSAMKMFASERRNKIMQLLQDNKRVTIKELSLEIGVSEATLRTDLNKLEKEGMLVRTHGGAVLNEDVENETSFAVRVKKNKSEKVKIAREAFESIEEKQCILLDASSTALELARHIKATPIRLTVITSGLLAALELSDNPNITVMMIGGVVTTNSTSIEGSLGIDMLNHVNIDIMFTSANGFSIDDGLTDFNLYEVALKQEIVSRSKKVIGIIDSSKIGTDSSSVFANIDQIDKLITDKPLNSKMSQSLLEKNIEVVITT